MFPCILKILPTCIFNKKDPIVLGVEVAEGIAKVRAPGCCNSHQQDPLKRAGERRCGAQVGTPITVPSQGGVDLGRIASMELNHKAVDSAKKGDSVAMKLEPTNTTEGSRLYVRHFDFKVPILSFQPATCVTQLGQRTSKTCSALWHRTVRECIYHCCRMSWSAG